jgi:hypothetical protein
MHALLQAAEIFAPVKLTVCISAAPGAPPATQLRVPAGYEHLSACVQRLPCGSVVTVHSLQTSAAAAAAALPEPLPSSDAAAIKKLPDAAQMEEDEDDVRSVLTRMEVGSVLEGPEEAGASQLAALLACGGSRSGSADGLAAAAAAAESACSEASEAGKATRPSSPEADWAGTCIMQPLNSPLLASPSELAAAVVIACGHNVGTSRGAEARCMLRRVAAAAAAAGGGAPLPRLPGAARGAGGRGAGAAPGAAAAARRRGRRGRAAGAPDQVQTFCARQKPSHPSSLAASAVLVQ